MGCVYCAGRLRTPVSNWFCIGDLEIMIPEYHSAEKINILNQEHLSEVYLSLFYWYIIHFGPQ